MSARSSPEVAGTARIGSPFCACFDPLRETRSEIIASTSAFKFRLGLFKLLPLHLLRVNATASLSGATFPSSLSSPLLLTLSSPQFSYQTSILDFGKDGFDYVEGAFQEQELYGRPSDDSSDGAVAEIDEDVDNGGLIASVVALAGRGELCRSVVFNDENQASVERDELGNQSKEVEAAEALRAERLAGRGEEEEL